MKTHIIENGVVVNTILATLQQARAAFPDAILVEAEDGSIGDTWDGEQFIKSPAPPTPVPDRVTRRQARQALLLAGLLDGVPAAIAAIPDETQRRLAEIEWEDSQVFERNRPLLVTLATALGLTSAQIDALFVTAAGL